MRDSTPSDRGFDTTSIAPDLGPETADVPLEGRRLGGRFRIVRTLGSGGMGKVYEVLSDDGQHFAAKVISRELVEERGRKVSTDRTTVKRFFREARAAQAIESEHVVKTFELGLDDALSSPFIVMELLDGLDLAAMIAERAPLTPAIVARIGVQAARGLGAAHAVGVVHRDVKPSNVFLHRQGEHCVVKVCDFGIAKLLGESSEQASHELTRTGGLLGSPRYMSPEQAKSARRVDHRSDIWSLCITLYEALTGIEVWSGRTSVGELIVAICTESLTPLAESAPWVEPALARIIERGLEREPEARWASMDALADALSKACAGGLEVRFEQLVRAADAPARSQGRSARSTPRTSAPRRARVWIVTAIAIAAVAGIAFATLAPRTPAANPTPNRVDPVARVARELRVPEDSTVRVNGTSAVVTDGHVTLSGEPGEGFDIVVERGAETRSLRVYVTKLGELDPPNVVIESAPTPAPSAIAAGKTSKVHLPASIAKPSVPPPPASGALPPAEPRPAVSGPLTPKETW